MISTNKLPGGRGWILPDMKCLVTHPYSSDISTLIEADPFIRNLTLPYIPKYDIKSILDAIYGSRYIRVGRYKDTILFEHGALRRPTLHDMAEVCDNARYKGISMRLTRDLYNPEDTERNRFFTDKL